MSRRVSETVLLCEDDAHEGLVRAYLEKCGLNTQPPVFRPRNSSRESSGGGVAWVINEFPKEFEACAKRNALAKTLLIVVIDADDATVDQRRKELNQAAAFESHDPALVVLIPKRHVETWVRAAIGHSVNETDDCKKPRLTKADFRAAATRIHQWARENALDPPQLASLRQSFSEWRKIG